MLKAQTQRPAELEPSLQRPGLVPGEEAERFAIPARRATPPNGAATRPPRRGVTAESPAPRPATPPASTYRLGQQGRSSPAPHRALPLVDLAPLGNPTRRPSASRLRRGSRGAGNRDAHAGSLAGSSVVEPSSTPRTSTAAGHPPDGIPAIARASQRLQYGIEGDQLVPSAGRERKLGWRLYSSRRFTPASRTC